jgi:hypothetical protein
MKTFDRRDLSTRIPKSREQEITGIKNGIDENKQRPVVGKNQEPQLRPKTLGRTAPQPVSGVLSRATHKASVAAVGALVRRGDSPTPIEATGDSPSGRKRVFWIGSSVGKTGLSLTVGCGGLSGKEAKQSWLENSLTIVLYCKQPAHNLEDHLRPAPPC